MNRYTSVPLHLLVCLCFVTFAAVLYGAGNENTGTYKIGPQTEITVDGESAPVTSLKVGMRVSVQPDSFSEGFAASIEAHSIVVVPVDPNAPKKKAVNSQAFVIASVSATSITTAVK